MKIPAVRRFSDDCYNEGYAQACKNARIYAGSARNGYIEGVATWLEGRQQHALARELREEFLG